MMDPTPPVNANVVAAQQYTAGVNRRFQHFLDRSVPHHYYRWIGSLAVALIYGIRVYYIQGYYIVTYGLGIYLLNLLIGFLSPRNDPESEGPTLPSKDTDEYKPFVRRLPEFKFW
jgi:hypothetical protein